MTNVPVISPISSVIIIVGAFAFVSISIVKEEDSSDSFPALSVTVVVNSCSPFDKGLVIFISTLCTPLPFKSALVTICSPITFEGSSDLSYIFILSPTSASAGSSITILGVVSFVRLSVFEVPVSDSSFKYGTAGALGD